MSLIVSLEINFLKDKGKSIYIYICACVYIWKERERTNIVRC